MKKKTFIPSTLEAAIEVSVSGMDAESVAFIKKPDSSPASQHFFAGMAMRNQWELWGDSVLAQHFKERFGLGHADDMSGIILAGIWAAVRGEPFDPEVKAEHYRQFWVRQGIDPLTQEKTGSIPGASLGTWPRKPRKPTIWQRLLGAALNQKLA